MKHQVKIMKEKGLKLEAQLKAMESKMKGGNPLKNLSDIHKIQDLVNQSQSLAFYIDFPLQINNKTKTIFDKRFDAKEINPQMSEAIVYGYMTIKI